MYAVIRAGGKQYRVAPGDVIEIEKVPQAAAKTCSSTKCWRSAPPRARSASRRRRLSPEQVVEQGRAGKVLVFHYKRKKQYKKLNGHRQPFTAVKITGINVDGTDLTA